MAPLKSKGSNYIETILIKQPTIMEESKAESYNADSFKNKDSSVEVKNV